MSGAASRWTLASPNGRVVATVSLTDGELSYAVTYERGVERTTVIRQSRLGLSVNGDDTATGLQVREAGDPELVEDEYRLAFGKRLVNRATAHQRTLGFSTVEGSQVDIVFRVADDGVAFRYRLPEIDGDWTIDAEHSEFRLPDGRCWIAPYDEVGKWGPAYETLFVAGDPIGSPPPSNHKQYPGWQFPALFHVESLWALVTESDLDRDYCGCHLAVVEHDGTARDSGENGAGGGTYRIAFPPAAEALGVGSSEPSGSGSMQTPWRLIIIAPELQGIVESSLVTDLARPSQVADASWIKPGRSSWSWWSDFGSSTDHDALRSFIDLAADMGWEYATIDANWHTMDDDDVQRLIRHADDRGVGLFLWFNSGGPTNDVPEGPRDRLSEPGVRREMLSWLQRNGIVGLKVDFFDSDKQVVIRQYLDLLEDAARHGLLVNLHGSTLPRGWERTWPNCISMEAVRGGEQYRLDTAWAAEAPRYNAILPFTRNAVGPVDYTPLAIAGPGIKRVTTDGHELALCVVLESGVVTLAGSVEAVRSLPADARGLLRDLPTAWEETRLVAGSPGELAVVARRSGTSWWLAGINGCDHPLPIAADLSFLGDGEFVATTVTDARAGGGLRRNRIRISGREFLNIRLRPAGGFLTRAVPIAEVDDPPDADQAPRPV